jgi:hypothetical protein
MNVKLDLKAVEHALVLRVLRPSYKDAEIVLLKGDVWVHNEMESDSTLIVRNATDKEIRDELETRAYKTSRRSE